MQYITSDTLIDCLGNRVPTEKVLRNKQQIILVFTATWSKQNRELLLRLKDLYQTIKKWRLKMEVIYVSCDANESIFMHDYLINHHGWYAVPLKSPTIWELLLGFDIIYIPQIVVSKIDGTIITLHGIEDFNALQNNVLIKWSESMLH